MNDYESIIGFYFPMSWKQEQLIAIHAHFRNQPVILKKTKERRFIGLRSHIMDLAVLCEFSVRQTRSLIVRRCRRYGK